MEDPGAAQFDNATVEKALHKAITDQDVDAVRRLLATPGYRFPATPTAVFSLLDKPTRAGLDPRRARGERRLSERTFGDRTRGSSSPRRLGALLSLRFTHTHRATRRHVAVHGVSARVRQRRVVQSVARGEGARDAVSTTALHQTASSRVVRRPELDAPPLPPPRRRALPQMPRVLLVPGPVETGPQRDGLPPRLRSC